MTRLWTSTALCLALALGSSAPAWAAGTEPETPAATDAKPATPECKEADKTKCPPADAAKPADAKPADAAATPATPECKDADKSKCPPAEAVKPADAKPADAKPADAKPADAKPVDAKPVDAAKPADETKPADAAKPADAKPADAAKPADPAAAPATPECKEADKSKCPPGKQGFLEKYHAAVALIDAGKYEDALVAMKALDDGTSADVVNYIGYINRKMGKMAQAQMYYEAALHMRPNHRGALEYYGEWYCMMGNVEKAKANLATIKTVYGADTKEYVALSRMIDDTLAKQKS